MNEKTYQHDEMELDALHYRAMQERIAYATRAEPVQVMSALAAVEKTYDYSKCAFVLDVSHYDPKLILSKLKGNIDALIVKMGGTESYGGIYSDDLWAQHIQDAYDLDIPCGAYLFGGPRIWLEGQNGIPNVEGRTDAEHPVLQFVLRQMKNKVIHFFVIDIEAASLWTSAGQVTDTWLRFFCEDLFKRLRKYYPDMPFGVYSSKSFLDEHGKELATWLGTQPDLFMWEAIYPNTTPMVSTIDVVKATRRPAPTNKPSGIGWCNDRPLWWSFWQYSGECVKTDAVVNLLGQPVALDLNLYNGTKEALYKWLGYTPRGADLPVEPEPTYRYYAKMRAGQYPKLRSTPNASITTNVLDTSFHPAIQFELDGAPIVDGSITWASLGKAYFAISQGASVYADVTKVEAR